MHICVCNLNINAEKKEDDGCENNIGIRKEEVRKKKCSLGSMMTTSYQRQEVTHQKKIKV